MKKRRRVVITGMGVVSCFGMDVDKFYQDLLSGKSGIRPITAFPCEHYPVRFAGSVRDFEVGDYMDKKQAKRVDPFIRYIMVAGKKAMEDARITAETMHKLDKSRCGVLVGSGIGGMTTFFDKSQLLVRKGFRHLSPFFVPYIIPNMGGAMLAIDNGFTGLNYSISAACATANYCIIAAARHIEREDADLVICGGAEAPINAVGIGGFFGMKALSERHDACEKASRPWDKSRDGFVLGEGAGLLVLEELGHAQKREAPILGEYLGGATSCDAYHLTRPREEGVEVVKCIEAALRDGNVGKEEVNYINAHATSTVVGDLCELMGYRQAFGGHSKYIKINATKSMIGHCLGAAAGIEAIASVKAMNTSMLHPTINVEDPEEELQYFDPVLGEAQYHEVNVALSFSLGFGGHNSAVLFAPYEE